MVQWFIDLVARMNPDSWSMENVVPVRKYLDTTSIPYVTVNSNDYGVAQKRKRVFAGEGWVLKPTNVGLTVQDVLPDLVGSTLEPSPYMRSKKRWTKLGVDKPFPTVTSCSPSQIRIVSRRRKAHEEPQSYTIDKPAHTITQVNHIVEEIDEDTKIDQINLLDRQMMHPATRHKWVARLIQHKRTKNELERRKKLLKEEVVKTLEEKGIPTGLPKASLMSKVENSDGIKKITQEIEDVDLMIEYLERVEQIFKSMTYDLKNIVDISKMEMT